MGLTSESRISESDFLVLRCLTKSACNPLGNFAILAFAFAAKLKMAGSEEKGTMIRGVYTNNQGRWFNVVVGQP